MVGILYFFVAMAAPILCAGQNPSFKGESLYMSGFHLCTLNETRNVSVLVVHIVAYTEEKPCGSWLMWLTCTVTLYKMVHKTEVREVTHQVIRCCDGYEKVGRYCALSFKRSDLFGAKPGSCPNADGFYPTSEDSGWDCEWDTDCPDWQKCCQTVSRFVCCDPESVANTGRYHLNASVTVKTDYHQLLLQNGSLLNHTRILQAMVAGVLQTDLSVYYLASWPVHPHRTATSLLIDSSSPLPLHSVKSKLLLLLKHIQEVTSVSVDDVNECGHAALRHCSPQAVCSNMVGSYQCTCMEGYSNADPVNTGARCAAIPTITSVHVANITGTSFGVYWSTNSEDFQTFTIALKTATDVVATWHTNETMVTVEELEPSVLYNVSVALSIHGNQSHTVHVLVRTEAQTLDATTRLINVQFTDDLKDMSSEAFQNLSNSIMNEIYQAHELDALVNSGQLRIKIKNFSPGSVVVSFTIILIPAKDQDITNTSKVVLLSLNNSPKFTVDKESTRLTDFDECASGDHDCSQRADCINSWASYTCVCQDGFTDINTQRPGRACQAALATTTISQTSSVDSASPGPTTTATSPTFATVTTDPLVSHTPTLPFSLSDAPTSVSTALTPSTWTALTHTPTPPSTDSTSTAPTSQSSASERPSTAPSKQTTATTIQFASASTTSAASMRPSKTSTAPIFTSTFSSSVTPSTMSSSILPATTSSRPTTLSSATSIITTSHTAPSMSTTTVPTSAPTTTLSADLIPTTRSIYLSTAPTSTAPTTVSTAPTTSSTAPTTLFSAPITSSTAPTTLSTAPITSSTAPKTSSTAPITSSTAPTTLSTAPITSSTAPITSPTAPITSSTAPITSSTAPTTLSTAPITSSTAPTTSSPAPITSSTAPITSSTAPITSSTAPKTSSLAPITSSSAPTSSSTAPTTSPTAPITSSPAPITSSPTPITSSLAPITSSTAPTTSSLAPTTLSTAPITSSHAPMQNAKCHTSLLVAISVQCRVASISVAVARDVLEQCRIMESSLYLGLEDCGVNGGNATHVQLTVAWNECATRLLHNDSAYTATVTLLNNMEPYVSASGIVEAGRMRLQVPIMCTYMRSMLMSADFSSVGYDMIKDVISSSGSFLVNVQLLNGTMPLPNNYSLSSDDVVVVEVSMNTSLDQIKVVIHSCWATTSPNPADAIRYIFLDNRCSLNSYTTVLMNGNSSTSRVSVQIFSFINAKMIYLHCQVQICVQMGSDTCVPDCVQRTARKAKMIGTAFGTSGPILNSDEEPVLENSTLYVVGFACLGVLLALAFIIGSVSLFYCQRNRIGNYNFNVKPKDEKFTYLDVQ